MSIFKFEPIYKKRVWGGKQFGQLFDPSLNQEEKFGESWNIVDREEDQSICKLDTNEAITIRELLARRGTEIMGPSWIEGKRFPILIKWR